MQIATSSAQEGLDFACNLACSFISMQLSSKPNELLASLSQFVVYRYVGEYELAFEELVEIGNLLKELPWQGKEQFNQQLQWLSGQLGASQSGQ